MPLRSAMAREVVPNLEAIALRVSPFFTVYVRKDAAGVGGGTIEGLAVAAAEGGAVGSAVGASVPGTAVCCAVGCAVAVAAITGPVAGGVAIEDAGVPRRPDSPRTMSPVSR